MALRESEFVSCDVLVIGGGGAGLRAAITAREMGARVTMVSKSRIGYGNNTYLSKTAFAAALGDPDPRDNPEIHFKDSVMGGRFLNDQGLLRIMTREVGSQIPFLKKCGVTFRKEEGKIAFTHVPGHTYPRHVWGERQTGKDYTLPLRAYARRIGIRFVEKVFITRLFRSDQGFTGAAGIDATGKFFIFAAGSAVVATGGFSQVYLYTNNASGMSGDGIGLCYDLGIPAKDIEFTQFYPTATGHGATHILLYEAFVFRAGGILRNAGGEDIIAKHGLDDPLAMTRDRLARAIMEEIHQGHHVEGGVLMDLGGVPSEDINRLKHLLPPGSSPDQRRFIVSPTAHFCMGGIVVDKNAATRIPGLFAAGEVSAGVHGANRLGGNALAEVFALGGVAGRNAALAARDLNPSQRAEREAAQEKERLESRFFQGEKDLRTLRRSIKELMWNQAGIIRNKAGLDRALEHLDGLKASLAECRIKDGKALIKSLELENMLLLSQMVCRAALLRTESRGAHFRSDYPEEDNRRWLQNVVVQKVDSEMTLQTIPVSLDPAGPRP